MAQGGGDGRERGGRCFFEGNSQPTTPFHITRLTSLKSSYSSLPEASELSSHFISQPICISLPSKLTYWMGHHHPDWSHDALPCTWSILNPDKLIITRCSLHELKNLCLKGAKMKLVAAACAVHLQDQELQALIQVEKFLYLVGWHKQPRGL